MSEQVVRFVVREQAGTSRGAPIREAKAGDVMLLMHPVVIQIGGEQQEHLAPLFEIEFIGFGER